MMTKPGRAGRPVLRAMVAMVAIAMLSAPPRAETQGTGTIVLIALSLAEGPPTTVLTVQGVGFDAEYVAVYFDDTRLTSVWTSTGSFTAFVSIPASATPGVHAMRGVGTRSRKTSPNTSFKVQTDWRQYGFSSAHTGYNPYENVIGPANAANLVQDWVKTVPSLPSDGDAWPSAPVVVDDRLHVTWNGFGYTAADSAWAGGFGVSGGAQIWTQQFPAGQGMGRSTPAVVGGRMYVNPTFENALPGARLYARSPATGAAQWNVVTASGPGHANLWSPTVGGGRVYLSTLEGVWTTFLQARDEDNGQLAWKIYVGQLSFGPAAYSGGWVYVAGSPNFYDEGPATTTLYGIHEPNGLVLWAHDFPFMTSNPIVAAGRVYVVGDGRAWALDAGSGDLLWQSDPLDLRGTPATAYGKVFVGATFGKVYALDRATGAVDWSSELPFQLADTVDGMQPAVANHVLYVGCGIGDEGLVTAFDADTGEVLFYALTESAPTGAAVADGRVFYTTREGKIYAYALP